MRIRTFARQVLSSAMCLGLIAPTVGFMPMVQAQVSGFESFTTVGKAEADFVPGVLYLRLNEDLKDITFPSFKKQEQSKTEYLNQAVDSVQALKSDQGFFQKVGTEARELVGAQTKFSRAEKVITDVSSTFDTFDVSKFEPFFPDAKTPELRRTYQLKYETAAEQEKLFALIEELQTKGGVEFEYVEPVGFVYTNMLPNDEHINDPASYVFPLHDLPEAYDISTTGSEIKTVAVLDSGHRVKHNNGNPTGHEDLVPNLWMNQAEVNGQAGVDDDNNGYVDDISGWDYCPTGNINSCGSAGTDNDPWSTWDSSLAPGMTHGGAVASEVTAGSNDTTGMAAPAYNNANYYMLKLGPDDGYTGGGGDNYRALTNYAEALRYAIEDNEETDIISMSFGGGPYNGTIQALFNEAAQNNILNIAAAGNNGSQQLSYPCAYDNVMCIAAATPSGSRASFSQYGSHVHVAAAGQQVWGAASNADDTHGKPSGTSMATPHTSSIAAFVWSHAPTLTAQEVQTILQDTAQPNSYTAHGLLDACLALSSALNLDGANCPNGPLNGGGGTNPPDNDGDGIANNDDNCPNDANADQADSDGDGIGDVCDTGGGGNLPDSDGDGVDDTVDNCLNTPNPGQEDADGNGVGDACEPGSGPVDSDGDGVADSADNCPNDANADQADSDGDGVGDVCDTGGNLPDSDGDGVDDTVDNCLNTPNPGQEDADGNGVGDACEPVTAPVDSDGDTIPDTQDNCPNDANTDQADNDGDGIGNVCDPTPDPPGQVTPDDLDGDGIANGQDNCPTTANADQTDTDSDTLGDVCDADDDNDGVADADDLFPLDPADWADFDNDGQGDNADADDDNDGWTDDQEIAAGTNPRNPNSFPGQTDGGDDDDTDGGTGTPSGDFTVVVNGTPATGTMIQSGDVIEYSIAITNTTDTQFDNVEVIDVLPTGATFISAVNDPSGYLRYREQNLNGVDVEQVIIEILALAGGATETVSYSVNAPTMNPGQELCNGIVASDTDAEYGFGNISATVSDDVCHPAFEVQSDMSVETTVEPTQATTWDSVAVTMTITNDGNAELQNIAVEGAMPPYFSFDSIGPNMTETAANVWQLESPLAVGSTQTITLNLTVNNQALSLANGANVALPLNLSITADGTPSVPVSAMVNFSASQSPLELRTSSNPAAATALSVGQMVSYTYTLANVGSEPLTSIMMMDELPTGVTFVEQGSDGNFIPFGVGTGQETVMLFVDELEVGAEYDAVLNLQITGEGTSQVCSEVENVVGYIGQTDTPVQAVTTSLVCHEAPETSGLSAVLASGVLAAGSVPANTSVPMALTVYNGGAQTLSLGTVLVKLPPQLKFLEGENATSYSILENGQEIDVVSVFLPAVNPGANVMNITTQTTANATSPNACATVHSVSAMQDNTPIVGTGNAVCSAFGAGVTASIAQVPVLNVELDGTPMSVAVGDEVTIKMTVENISGQSLEETMAYVQIPSTMAFVAANGDSSATEENGRISLNFGGLLASDSITSSPMERVTLTLKAVRAGQMCLSEENVNTRHSRGLGVLASDPFCIRVEGEESARESLVQFSSSQPSAPAIIANGSAITYTATIQNTAETSMTGAVAVFPLDSFLQFSSADSSGVTYPSGQNETAVEVRFGTIKPGEMVQKSFTATVNAGSGGTVIMDGIFTATQDGDTVRSITNELRHRVGRVGVTPPRDDSDVRETDPTTNETPQNEQQLNMFNEARSFAVTPATPQCADGFSNDGNISTTLLVFDPAPAVRAWTDRAVVPPFEAVTYRATTSVKLLMSSTERVARANVYLYNVALPNVNGEITGRTIDTDSTNWEQLQGQNGFALAADETLLEALSTGDVADITLVYGATAQLTNDRDIAENLRTTAYAVVEAEIVDDADGSRTVVLGVPTDELNCETNVETLIAEAMANRTDAFAQGANVVTVTPVRSFFAGQNGAVISATDGEMQTLGTNIPSEYLHVTLQDQAFYQTANEVVNTENMADAVATQLENIMALQVGARATDALRTYPQWNSVQMTKAADRDIYFTDGDLSVGGTYDVLEDITIVVRGDLSILENVRMPEKTITFIVLGDAVHVSKTVTSMDMGIVATGAQLLPFDPENLDPTTNEPLTVNGVLIGLNPRALANARTYKGENPTAEGVKPSALFTTDVRFFENPALRFLLESGAEAQE